MDSSDPVGGQWNYDHENQKKMPKGEIRRPLIRMLRKL